MHSTALIALLALIAGASSQCFGGGCGGGGPIFLPPPPCFGGNCGCSGNNCGPPPVTVVQIPNNNGCSCDPCSGPICAPRCDFCPPPPPLIVPIDNGCSCNPCNGPICAPRCNSCPPPPPIFLTGSSCCNNNSRIFTKAFSKSVVFIPDFSCCGFRARRHLTETSSSETTEQTTAAPTQE
uniref:CC domain-containing protein n=1 Tax=Caenorhabditis japonica TaxID=281687 RepID=A0A8R1HSL8_CAEJA